MKAENNNNGSTPNVKQEQPETAGPQNVSSAPSISLPKGGGAIRGIGEKFGANPVTGTGSMTVPIATSPGRSGFGPQLSLSYDSGSGNGPFGIGWNLSLPQITRKTDKGLPQYNDADETDVFILSGAEDLVPVSPQPVIPNNPGYTIKYYRPRIEGLFARIERWTNNADPTDVSWRSISRENITTWYGKTKNSRIFDPVDATSVFSWLICESYDDKGNAILYTYQEENANNVDLAQANERNRGPADDPRRNVNRYLKGIKYGNKESRLVQPDLTQMHWLFEVVFDYEEGHYLEQPADNQGMIYTEAFLPWRTPWPVRQDPFSSYRSGFEVRTYRLCKRVLMFHHFRDDLGGVEDYLVRSTEFSYNENLIGSFISSVVQSGYVWQQENARYLKKSLPPLEFEYTQAAINDMVQNIDSESCENLPSGADGSRYQWVDLDGEGYSGILTEQAGAWFYKRNLSPLPVTDSSGNESVEARFAPQERIAIQPTLSIAGGRGQFMDLAGDGKPDLVTMEGSVRGFYEHTEEDEWETFRPFTSWPNVDTRDSNVKFVDLNGDGHADILITEDEAIAWHQSLAEDGFGPEQRVAAPFDEEKGPRIVFGDGTQSVYLADLTGDGLTDLVRIRNGEICYWPNLGYGKFGAKVTMDNSPWFDALDLFDQKRIRLADIDGSGTTDIIYLSGNGAAIYRNECGNSWSDPEYINFAPIDDITSVMTADLFGNGTACLVWSSPLPGDAYSPFRYIDLMGGQKPHLLIKTKNNLGAETVVTYAASTKFYLKDKEDGNPWITKLPFPVHVVERVETFDRVSKNYFSTRYKYHHGFFDGVEREFRGFGMVEQTDTEEFVALTSSTAFPTSTNLDSTSHVPPVLTKTWFHTGAYFEEGKISKQFEHEYYRESGQQDGQELPDTFLPNTLFLPDGSRSSYDLTADEEREACRALKGSILRQEVYALDGTEKEKLPYSVSERNYTIECLQPQGTNRYSVFFAHARETIDFHYERALYTRNGGLSADPRVSHALTLEVDCFGNALKTASIGYGRRFEDPDPILTVSDKQEQKRMQVTYTENDYTNAIQLAGDYRTPMPAEARTYEIRNISVDPGHPFFTFTELSTKLQAASDGSHDLPYEDIEGAGITDNAAWRRLIECVRTLYRRNNLNGLLPLKTAESLALPGESFKLAFSPGLLTNVFRRLKTDNTFEELLDVSLLGHGAGDGGGYVDLDSNGHWWIPTGRVFFSVNYDDNAPAELAYTKQHFFLPVRYRGPFNNDQFRTETLIKFDNHDLLVQETQDALGNRVVSELDYRVLQPKLITDPNGNQSKAVFDALGMVAATAVIGKSQGQQGDLLDEDYPADLSPLQLADFLADPRTHANDLLGTATTRIVYDVESFKTNGTPAFAATIARETHVSDLGELETTKVQISFSYSDGFGREIQKKIQAEAGEVEVEDASGNITTVDTTPNLRWVGSGWTIFNNKGKPVRQYEPFFSVNHQFQFGKKVGVSPILFYDPAERVIATLHPNNTYEKVVFDPWKQTTWDVNDTVLLDPRTDPDVVGYMSKYFSSQPADWKTWVQLRLSDPLSPPIDTHGANPEQDAAVRTLSHADTPAISYFDSLGRNFLAIADNGPDKNAAHQKFQTRTKLDIENNQREVIDAKGRIVMHYDYDMLGNRIHQASMEAGERWILNDVAGKPLYSWDSRGHQFRTIYDQLRRPVSSCLLQGADPEVFIGRMVYGESQPNPEANNLRGKTYQAFDQAGVVTTDAYDFKGNLLSSSRQLAVEYKTTLDWSQTIALEPDVYASSTAYDALNRPITLRTPDNSIIHPGYNEANLLERISANLRGAANSTSFITNINYNAKGQRVLIDYANNVRTTYAYDPVTFRLTQILTTNSATELLQALAYTYDPTGNITYIRDDAQQTVYFRNQRVEPSGDYMYDAIYRLIEGRGREHLGQVAPTAPDAFNGFHTNLDQPGDGDALGKYVEQYVYDAVGNFISTQHWKADNPRLNWTRTYAYGEKSPLDGKYSNRLTSTRIGQTTENYAYAGNEGLHGNITSMLHLQVMRWDFHDQLQATAKQAVNDGSVPETTYYVYDASGQRVRKVTESAATAADVSAGRLPSKLKERIYLGGFEIYQEYAGSNAGLKRETLHIMDDKQRVAMVETRNEVNDDSPVQVMRYQFTNHLGSASLELDETATVISYEEYFPYGSTSYQAVSKGIKAAAKRYRYTGKERDEENGFYYHGARYYAPWLGRWTACDPLASIDAFFSHLNTSSRDRKADKESRVQKVLLANLYRYASGNPLSYVDPNGREDIIVVGTQQHPEQVRNPSNKFNFAHQAIREAKSGTTVLMYKEGYTDKQLEAVRGAIEKKGGKLIGIDTADQLITYLNTKTAPGKELKEAERGSDLITKLTIFAHGRVGVIAFGYGSKNEDKMDLTLNRLNELSPKAFDKFSDVTINACRIGLGNPDIDKKKINSSQPERSDESLAQKIANQIQTNVKAYKSRCDYNDTLSTSDDRGVELPLVGRVAMSKELEERLKNRRMVDGAEFDPEGALHPVKAGTTPEGVYNSLVTFRPGNMQ